MVSLSFELCSSILDVFVLDTGSTVRAVLARVPRSPSESLAARVQSGWLVPAAKM